MAANQVNIPLALNPTVGVFSRVNWRSWPNDLGRPSALELQMYEGTSEPFVKANAGVAVTKATKMKVWSCIFPVFSLIGDRIGNTNFIKRIAQQYRDQKERLYERNEWNQSSRLCKKRKSRRWKGRQDKAKKWERHHDFMSTRGNPTMLNRACQGNEVETPDSAIAC
jgi:hypothetical protein